MTQIYFIDRIYYKIGKFIANLYLIYRLKLSKIKKILSTKGFMCFIENSTKHNQIVLHIFGFKFSFRNNLKFYFWELIGLFLDFYFFLKRINLNKNYKIISL